MPFRMINIKVRVWGLSKPFGFLVALIFTKLVNCRCRRGTRKDRAEKIIKITGKKQTHKQTIQITNTVRQDKKK